MTSKSKKGLSTPLVVLFNIGIALLIVSALLVAAHYSLRYITRSSQRVEVPSFEGLSIDEAKQLAKQRDLVLYINDSLYVDSAPKGSVLEQQPAAGVGVKPDRTIYIIINAFGDKLVKMPYVADLSLRQAINTLQAATFTVYELVYEQDIATNYILSQEYKGRSVNSDSDMLVRAGEGVVLTVGVDRRRNPYTSTPLVEGMPLSLAKRELWESGFNIGEIKYAKDLGDNKGVVVFQHVEPESIMHWGDLVSLTIGDPSDVMVREVVEDKNE